MPEYFVKTAIGALTAVIFLTACSASTRGTSETVDCVVIPPEKPFACTMQYDPVCGCDGTTYGNACMARGAGVPHSTPGACEANSNN